MRFVKKSIVIEATQWFKVGDHEKVVEFPDMYIDNSDSEYCKVCNKLLSEHGYIQRDDYIKEGGLIVCPSDWIIKGFNGEYFPCNRDIFEMTYEKIGD